MALSILYALFYYILTATYESGTIITIFKQIHKLRLRAR